MMTKLENRIRNGLHETAERIPETGIRLKEAAAKRARPMWVGVAAVLGVLVLFSPVFLLDRTEPLAAPEEPTDPSTAVPATTVPVVEAEPDYLNRFPVVVEVEETGELIGVQRGHAFKSSDGGDSWSEILVDGGADLIDVAPDGTLIAIGNSEEKVNGVFGPDTWVREAPKVHIYDPAAADWSVSELPRPEFPVADPQPAPMDGSGGCGLAGIHWSWDALSMTISDKYVIAGEQRIVEKTLCDESFQFFWTSTDGITWSIVDPAGVPGYAVGITTLDDTFIAYGSDVPWYHSTPDRTVKVWTSAELANWEASDIDLSVLPPNGYPTIFPDEEATWGLGGTVRSTVSDGALTLEIPIGLAAPGPDRSVGDLDELNEWAEANNRPTISQDILDSFEITFPLDEDEVETLTLYFHGDEGSGVLILETDDGVTWTSHYEGR